MYDDYVLEIMFFFLLWYYDFIIIIARASDRDGTFARNDDGDDLG
jgi:hypothetical protein